MQTYRISPLDLLFFRDGRPLDVDKSRDDHRNIGHGDFWPRPDHLYNAVMHALVGSRIAGERASYGKFGGLRTTGPFPLLKNPDGTETLFLPRPLDWDCVPEPLPKGKTDAPEFLEWGFVDRTPGKKSYPAWIPLADYHWYLAGDPLPPLSHESLFMTETRVGNTLDSATGASRRVQDQRHSGQYEAQYLRLRQGVSMWGEATSGTEGTSFPSVLHMGGQGFLVYFDRDDSLPSIECVLPAPKAKDSLGPFFVRWTLLAPALFARTGWLPGWCRDTGKDETTRKPEGTVMFPDCAGASLVAACTGKPIVFSGYDTVDGVKDTQLAVPAGSCYVFRCETREAAKSLVARLHLQRQSDFGSQGFGIGVCSFVEYPDREAANT